MTWASLSVVHAWVGLGLQSLLVLVLGAAGVAKLVDRAHLAPVLDALGLGSRNSVQIAYALAVTEISVAAFLILPSTVSHAATAAGSLFVLYTVAIAVLLAQGERPSCNCFGVLSSRPVGPGTLVRNGGLAAGAFVLAGLGAPDVTILPSVHARDVVLAGCLVGFGVLIVLGRHILMQQGRMLMRIEELEQITRRPRIPVEPLGVGATAPIFGALTIDGRDVALGDLLSHPRGLLLMFTDPACPACPEVTARCAAWIAERQDVLLAVVGGTPREGAVATSGTVWLRQDRGLAERYGVLGVPSVILIGADGRIASVPAMGAAAIDDLLGYLGGVVEVDPIAAAA